jgi:hypothetical protein
MRGTTAQATLFKELKAKDRLPEPMTTRKRMSTETAITLVGFLGAVLLVLLPQVRVNCTILSSFSSFPQLA